MPAPGDGKDGSGSFGSRQGGGRAAGENENGGNGNGKGKKKARVEERTLPQRDRGFAAGLARDLYNETFGKLTGVSFDDAPRADHDPLNQGSGAGGEGANRPTQNAPTGGGYDEEAALDFSQKQQKAVEDWYTNWKRELDSNFPPDQQPNPTTQTSTSVPTLPSFRGFAALQAPDFGPTPVFAFDPDRFSPGGPLTDPAELPEQAQKVRDKIRQEAENIVEQTTRNRRGRRGLKAYDETETDLQNIVGNIAGYGAGRRTLLGG